MSRIGKKPIQIPKGVEVEIGTDHLEVKGPKGVLRTPVPSGIGFKLEDSWLKAERAGDELAALHGLARALAANAIRGVSSGFSRELDIIGVGYKAELKGKMVVFSLGYSHPIEFPIPEGINIAIEKQTHLVVSGADKYMVGQTAAKIRGLRPPDPYKQKGVRITGERLKKKAGKAGAKTAA